MAKNSLLRGLAVMGAVLSVVCLVAAIVGTVVLASSYPDPTCTINGSSRSGDGKDFSDFAKSLGGITLVGGVFGVLAGILTTGSALRENKCGIIAACVVSIIAIVVLIISANMNLIVTTGSGAVCDDFVCEDHLPESCRSNPLAGLQLHLFCYTPEVCCKYDCTSTTLEAHGVCKNEKDYLCDLRDRKGIAMGFQIFAFILAIALSSCQCGAGCCCPGSFGMDQGRNAGQGQTTASQVPTVVGQPVMG